MPFDKSFWIQLATKHGVAKETAEAIATNDKFLGDLDEMLLRRDDAKGLMESTAAEKRAAEAAKAEAVRKYQENLQWYTQKQSDLALLDQYRTTYPDFDGSNGAGAKGNGNGNGANGNGSGIKPEDIEARILKSHRDQYVLNKQIIKATQDYRKHFGEELPLDDLEEIALKPENANRPFNEVYRDWVEPKLEVKKNTEWETKLKAAREEGEKAGLAKGRMREPTADLPPDQQSPIWHPIKPEAKPDDVTLQRNFVETFLAEEART